LICLSERSCQILRNQRLHLRFFFIFGLEQVVLVPDAAIWLGGVLVFRLAFVQFLSVFRIVLSLDVGAKLLQLEN